MALTEKLIAIADAIRDKTGGTEGMTLDEMPTQIAGIETGGGENRFDYQSSVPSFQNAVFESDAEITVRYGAKAKALEFGTGAFMNVKNLKKVTVIYDGTLTGKASAKTFFRGSSIVTVDLTGVTDKIQFSSLDRMFYSNALCEILGEMDLSACTTTNYAFVNCYSLETIRIKPGTLGVSTNLSYSLKLTDESIQSIIDGLADLTGGTAQTLTLHADVGAKLTEEQKAAAAAKNWTLAY